MASEHRRARHAHVEALRVVQDGRAVLPAHAEKTASMNRRARRDEKLFQAERGEFAFAVEIRRDVDVLAARFFDESFNEISPDRGCGDVEDIVGVRDFRDGTVRRERFRMDALFGENVLDEGGFRRGFENYKDVVFLQIFRTSVSRRVVHEICTT